MLSTCINKKKKKRIVFCSFFIHLFLSDLDGFFLQQIQLSTNNNDYP